MPKHPDEQVTADADRLVRSEAGVYRTADDRFEVRAVEGTWYLVDTALANELGQEVIRGPFGTRREAAAAIGEARSVRAPDRTKARKTRRR